MTDRLDLPDRYRRQLEALLAEHVPDAEAWAYGSRVNGRSHPASDLDLVFRGPGLERIPASQLAELEEAIEQSNIPILIQTHDWARLPASFHSEIKKQYVVLHEPTSAMTPDRSREITRGQACAADTTTRTLGDVAEITMGQSPPGSTVAASGETPLLNGPTEFGPSHPVPTQFTSDGRKFANPGDILFCVRGSTTGRMNWADQPYAIGRGVASIRHRSEPSLQHLVRAVIEYELPKLLGQATGSTFPNVSAQHLAAIAWPNIEPQEQHAISRVLGALDDRIELNRRMSMTLEEMARALFRSWFVDFDPVRATAEGRPSGLPPDLDVLFPAAFEDSELGEIPAGWTILPAGEAVAVKGGSTPSTKEPAYWGDQHYFATPKDLSLLQQPVLVSTARRLTNAGIARIPSGLLPERTVLLSSRAPIGYLAMAGKPVAINQGIIAMICEGPVGATYALHWAQASIDAIKTRGSGTTFAEISKSSFRDIPFLVPQASAHAAWESLVVPLYDRVASLTRQQLALVGQRDALLPRLLSGKLRVGGARRPLRAFA